MKKQILLLFICSVITSIAGGESLSKSKCKIHYNTGLRFSGSVKDKMPFWMRANSSGLYPNENNVAWDFQIEKRREQKKKISWDFGFMGMASVAQNADVLMRDYYIGAGYDKIHLSFGAKANELIYDGLSTTNGDFVESRNARPYPQLRLELDYTEVPFTKGWVQFKGLYSEGIMLDDRYVDDVRVHYKNLYIKLGKKKLSFEVGLKHYAQWGGESPVRGKLPTGTEVYTDLIFAKNNSKFDQLGSEVDYNRVGNHIGMYDVRLSYENDKLQASLYRQVIFEDSSGRNFTNKDALLGLYLRRKGRKSFLQSILMEYYYTKYQSGTLTGAKPDGGIYTGKDNYFNQSIYRSGWTSYGQTIGTPLFTPRYNSDGIAMGVGNNRITAFHGGVFGFLSSQCSYKALLTYSHNYGTYLAKIDKEQMSGYLEIIYSIRKIGANISFGLASDFYGDYLKKNTVGFIKISTNGWWRK